jgi:hypothetical protein
VVSYDLRGQAGKDRGKTTHKARLSRVYKSRSASSNESMKSSVQAGGWQAAGGDFRQPLPARITALRTSHG